MACPTLSYERKLWRQGCENVVGLDEVGVGPWAGPIVAGAVKIKSLKSKIKSQGLIKLVRDSKLLDWKRREEVYKFLTESDWLDWAVGLANVDEIDRFGLGEANRLAMKRAIGNLEVDIDFILIDAVIIPEYIFVSESIIKGDAKIFSIACASIIAKVTRDRLMRELAQKYPYWGFDKHKGYGTKFHREMIERYGICEIHRKSFKPIRKKLEA